MPLVDISAVNSTPLEFKQLFPIFVEFDSIRRGNGEGVYDWNGIVHTLF